MSCNRVRRTIFLWVDRNREERLRGPLEDHVGGCPHCRDRAMRVERFVVLLRTRCERRAAPESLHDRIRQLLGDPGDS
jgi:anti-sigma factor (TIGR02949 family)